MRGQLVPPQHDRASPPESHLSDRWPLGSREPRRQRYVFAND